MAVRKAPAMVVEVLKSPTCTMGAHLLGESVNGSVKVLCWVSTLLNVLCQPRQWKRVLCWFESNANLMCLTLGPLKNVFCPVY